jgi:hypothetical protein
MRVRWDAAETDWSPQNTEKKKLLEDAFKRMLDPNSDYFGE